MEERIELDEQERSIVEEELSAIREELNRERFEDLAGEVKSGNWFPKLLASSLRTYSQAATPEFFAKKYPGLPVDAVVDRQIELAQRYAAIEGGLTSAAYTTAVAATVTTAGGASPFTAPAALTAFSVDLFYLTRLQLRLAYDMSVLYGKPADIDDPEDLYDLISVAFGVKATEAATTAVNKLAPEAVRVGVKAVVKGTTLQSMKSLPVIGKHLLQRNVMKVCIPAVGVPLTVGMNYWSTGAVASAARQIYRDQALAAEAARKFVDYAADDSLLVSVVWAAIHADRATAQEEMCLLKNLVRFADEAEDFDSDDSDLGLDLDVESLLVRAAALGHDERGNLFEAALLAVAFDRKVHKKEREFLDRLASAMDIQWGPSRLKAMIRVNTV